MTVLTVLALASVLAGFLLAFAAMIDASVPLPTDPFVKLCDDAPSLNPVTEERTDDQESA